MMRQIAILLLLVMIAAAPLAAGNKEEERLNDAAVVLEEVLNIPDAIPQELLDKAECVVVVPSVKKFAIGFGGSYGRGVMVCRTGKDFSGPWGAPAMYALEGASFGLQLGGQATDFIFLVMNQKGAESLLKSKTKLGADASVAAGPKGRTANASTDAYMRAEILSYSRNRGLFAGISLEGSTLRPDPGATKKIYGRDLSAREIILESAAGVPAAGQKLVTLLQNASPKNLSS
jgi:lipid-binding SYLF domain-containing protein